MKKRRLNPTAIGAFVLGAIAIAVISIVLFGSGRWFSGERVSFVCFFEDAVDGMQIGSKVKLKGVPIGEVKRILLRFQQSNEEGQPATKPLIPVIIELDVERLANDLGEELDFRKDGVYKTQLQDGLRATLGISNLITGILQVNLDYHDDVKKAEDLEPFAYRGIKYRVIPTLPSQLAQATNDLLGVVNNISKADFKGVVDGLNTLLEKVNSKLDQFEVKGMNEAIAAFEARMEDPTFDEALNSFSEAAAAAKDATIAVKELAENLQGQVDGNILGDAITSAEDSFLALTEAIDNISATVTTGQTVPKDLSTTLKDFSSMATEIKELAALLKEHPNAILFGRKDEKDEETEPPARERKPWKVR